MVVAIDPAGYESNYYADLVQGQKIAIVSAFTLESGIELRDVPVAYKTWGTLNETRDNVLVLCHALSGSSDAEDWWRPLMGRRKTFDYDRFFIFCANMLGSPYGSASPLTIDPSTKRPYGPDFPSTTVRDDVRIHKLVLDALGVAQVAAVIGGSMGGFSTLEWSLCTDPEYVKTIIPITTSAYHSAWGISWGEAQRQCVYADGRYDNGWYDPVPSGQPVQGLGAARMIGMLTYRSHVSFEKRFGRKPAAPKREEKQPRRSAGLPTPSPSESGSSTSETERATKRTKVEAQPDDISGAQCSRGQEFPAYAAQSYMQYQASKFLKRFDANCYVSMTQKMDTHDVTRGRISPTSNDTSHQPTRQDLKEVFKSIPPGVLVVSVETDVLFRPELQMELAGVLPDAKLASLPSLDGHDGFLLEFEALGRLITTHLKERRPDLFKGEAVDSGCEIASDEVASSVFGEQEPEF